MPQESKSKSSRNHKKAKLGDPTDFIGYTDVQKKALADKKAEIKAEEESLIELLRSAKFSHLDVDDGSLFSRMITPSSLLPFKEVSDWLPISKELLPVKTKKEFPPTDLKNLSKILSPFKVYNNEEDKQYSISDDFFVADCKGCKRKIHSDDLIEHLEICELSDPYRFIYKEPIKVKASPVLVANEPKAKKPRIKKESSRLNSSTPIPAIIVDSTENIKHHTPIKEVEVEDNGTPIETVKLKPGRPPGESKKRGAKPKKTIVPKIKEKVVLDLDKHCGVVGADNIPCMRLITCKAHTVVMKKAVFGRSMTYQELVLMHQKNNAKLRAEQQAKAAGASVGEGRGENEDGKKSFDITGRGKRSHKADESSDYDSDLEVKLILEAVKNYQPTPLATYNPMPLQRRYELRRSQVLMQKTLYEINNPQVLSPTSLAKSSREINSTNNTQQNS